MNATILIIDDEPDIRQLVSTTLSRLGLDCHTAGNLEEARHLLATYAFDACLTDMRLPDGNGVEFVSYLQKHYPGVPVAVITAHGNLQAAVEAMKSGAFDFVSKPLDINVLRRLVTQAVEAGTRSAGAARSAPPDRPSSAGLAELSGRRGDSPPKDTVQLIGGERLVGTSEPIEQLRRLIIKVARTNAPVWITGESGTGKEVIARLIHDNGPRARHPFVAINCGAIPAELMESEMFGHRKGSFTGATTDREGLFRQAEGGTLFLDEVAELPLHMQVKLLRAIQERTVRGVGYNEEVPIDVRLLSASHTDLAQAVAAGTFRHDLYYRLNVISLRAPALRDRPGDIRQLIAHLLARLNADLPDDCQRVMDDSAISALETHHFPGNVRELENLLERVVALVDDSTITAQDLQLGESTSPNSGVSQNTALSLETDAGETLSKSRGTDAEAQRLIEVLDRHRWNRKSAAVALGLSYRQLRYRMQQLGLSDRTGDRH